MVGLTAIRSNGLQHLVLDTDGALVNPSYALFSPCRRGHLSGQVCQHWDQVDTASPPPPCRPYRYALFRAWDCRPPALFVMLNPSTADAFRLDPTLTRCRDFARRWRAGGMLVLNAFALRSTDPAVLRTHPDPVGRDNGAVIAALLAGEFCRVVVGWGQDTTMARSGRDTEIIDMIRAAGHTPTALAVNRDGSPRHPLYVGRWTTPAPYPPQGTGG